MNDISHRSWRELTATLQAGDVLDATVIGAGPPGVFVRLNVGLEGLIHRGSLAGAVKGAFAKEEFVKGSVLKAVIAGIDDENERIAFSTLPDDFDSRSRWQSTDVNSFVGNVYEGTVAVDRPDVTYVSGSLPYGCAIEHEHRTAGQLWHGTTIRFRVTGVDDRHMRCRGEFVDV